MSLYQGGKKRIGKKIYNEIIKLEREYSGDTKLEYIEPFCGMCSVLRNFSRESDRKVIGYDINKDLILLLEDIRNNTMIFPTTITKEEYEKARNEESSSKRAFKGIIGSWGGIFFGAYRLGYNCKRNYIQEGRNGLEKLGKDIQSNEIKFEYKSYLELNPKGKLIYCDPPYIGNKLMSKYFQNFDHSLFWKTMDEWSKDNLVIVSERICPSNWKSIWKSGNEHLFVITH